MHVLLMPLSICMFAIVLICFLRSDEGIGMGTLIVHGFSRRTHITHAALDEDSAHAKPLGNTHVAYLVLDHHAFERRGAHAAEHLRKPGQRGLGVST